MSSNTDIKRKMIRRYGNKCFIEALGFRKKEDVKAELKLYGNKRKRKIAQELTYHHILEKRKRWKSNS